AFLIGITALLGFPGFRFTPLMIIFAGNYRQSHPPPPPLAQKPLLPGHCLLSPPPLYEPCHKMRMPFSAFYAAGGEQ
ncbi:hypothetical protein ACUNE6_25800, partial [Serratia sp. IR-2025]